jgi:MEMO1 family protein
MDYPKLRPINAFPVQMSGRSLICLQDSQNISEKALFLPPQTYYIVTLFDGQHSLLDIQAEYMRQFGDLLFTEKLQEIIDQLDENFFLESERFQEVLRQIEDQYKKAPVREAAFAGKSYKADPEGLRSQLGGYFEGPSGPGPLGERMATHRLKGVVAPHIDFERGGSCYAFAHREIWEKSTAHCFIIFGIAHTGMTHPFSITRKDFATPLGKLETDRELVDAIQSRCPYDLFHDEGVHRSEHSVEFQCLFLRFLYPEPAPIKIVPILCGSFHEILEQGASPMELKPFRQFIEALAESVSDKEERVFYITSADLSHMGLQFGDRKGMKDYDLRVLEEADREMLGHVGKMDGEGFYSSILRERDQRKICGLPAIYTLLKVLKAKEGKVLNYGQAFTPETQSVVSFASLGFYE